MINELQNKKDRLVESTEKYKEDFENEFSELTSKVERGILAGLVIGGLSYLTFRMIKSMSKSKHEEESPSEPKKASASTDNSINKVVQYVAQTVALILINLAKEKLIEYLNERKQEQEFDSSEDS